MDNLWIDTQDHALIQAIQGGFPLTEHPFADIGQTIGRTESEVIDRLRTLSERGVIRRMGVIVRHHELGYQANAMVVWDVPDHEIAHLGQRIKAFDFVTLCYRRRRCLPNWPYNLYCMIHGRQREEVLHMKETLAQQCGLDTVPHQVLFSRRRFKQRGALYHGVPRQPSGGIACHALGL
jgi:DNA-binding Lrp family transcriptional regulator